MNYITIEKDNMLNGDGLRVVLWVSGCSMHCKNCQNPETWDYCCGKIFDDEAVAIIYQELNKDYIKGITITGGHPLDKANIDTVLRLCKKIKKDFSKKDIWIYTGYRLEELEAFKDYELLMEVCDVLVDGRYIDEQRDISLKWRGSTNQRVIDIQKTKKEKRIILYCE